MPGKRVFMGVCGALTIGALTALLNAPAPSPAWSWTPIGPEAWSS